MVLILSFNPDYLPFLSHILDNGLPMGKLMRLFLSSEFCVILLYTFCCVLLTLPRCQFCKTIILFINQYVVVRLPVEVIWQFCTQGKSDDFISQLPLQQLDVSRIDVGIFWMPLLLAEIQIQWWRDILDKDNAMGMREQQGRRTLGPSYAQMDT